MLSQFWTRVDVGSGHSRTRDEAQTQFIEMPAFITAPFFPLPLIAMTKITASLRTDQVEIKSLFSNFRGCVTSEVAESSHEKSWSLLTIILCLLISETSENTPLQEKNERLRRHGKVRR